MLTHISHLNRFSDKPDNHVYFNNTNNKNYPSFITNTDAIT